MMIPINATLIGRMLHTIDDSDFNIVISNNQKIIVKKKRKADTPTDVLFGSGSLLADIYGNDDDDADVWDDASLMDNQRFKKLCRLPQLGVYVDEAHHLFGANLEKELRSGGANKTSLRNTINMLAASTTRFARSVCPRKSIHLRNHHCNLTTCSSLDL